MKTIGNHVLMAEDELVGSPALARCEKAEGVLLLHRHREISHASLAGFVQALLATLQRDELHIDLIGEALVQSGFIREGPSCTAVHQPRHDERVAMLADILIERLFDDFVFRSALITVAGEVLGKLTSRPTTHNSCAEGAMLQDGLHAAPSRVHR